MNEKLIENFVRRLRKIGIRVELTGNYPWVYLDAVNGNPVRDKFKADHGYTAFFIPVRADLPIQFSDIKHVFNTVRKYARTSNT